MIGKRGERIDSGSHSVIWRHGMVISILITLLFTLCLFVPIPLTLTIPRPGSTNETAQIGTLIIPRDCPSFHPVACTSSPSPSPSIWNRFPPFSRHGIAILPPASPNNRRTVPLFNLPFSTLLFSFYLLSHLFHPPVPSPDSIFAVLDPPPFLPLDIYPKYI